MTHANKCHDLSRTPCREGGSTYRWPGLEQVWTRPSCHCCRLTALPFLDAVDDSPSVVHLRIQASPRFLLYLPTVAGTNCPLSLLKGHKYKEI